MTSTTVQKGSKHIVRQIETGLWQVEFLYPSTNCWLVQESDGLCLIDTAHSWSAPQILDAAKHIGSPLRRIVITHAHPDHAGAANELAELTGASVWAHECEVPYLSGNRSMANEPGFWACRLVLGMAHAFGGLHTTPISQLRTVADDDMIGSLRVVHTPGHTPGSISLWSESTGAIFCGDNLIYALGAVRIGLPVFTLDHKKQSASLSRYLDLPDAKMLLSGHGPVYRGQVAEAVRRLI